MAYTNTEENPSRKKYLVPLLVVLICGMSLTGAAYAYNSNLGTDGTLDVQSYEIGIGDTNEIQFTAALTYDSYILKDKVAYTANAFEEKITLVMKNAQHTKDFVITGAQVSCAAEGIVFTATYDGHVVTITGTPEKVTDEEGNEYIKTVGQPKGSYVVTLTVTTSGVAE